MEKNHDKLYSILLEMKEDIGEMKSDIKSTLVQTEKTNGRVGVLEKKVETHQSILDNWKGKLAVLVIMGGVIWDFVAEYVKSKINL